jgi:hypothetical protein
LYAQGDIILPTHFDEDPQFQMSKPKVQINSK